MMSISKLGVPAFLTILVVISYMIIDPSFTVFKLFGESDLTREFKYIKESSERVQDGYLVWSSGCRIVDVPAWDKSIERFVGQIKKVTCDGKRLSEVTGPAFNRTLEISPALLTTTCCLRQITREDNTSIVELPDDIYNISNCQHVNLTTNLPEDAQFIWVKCTKKGEKKEREVYSNMHNFVGLTPAVEEKLKKQTDQFKAGKMSVLMIGIDSISRLNLIRTMPKTVSYLNNNGWIDLQGYNKVDDNTFPNLLAILTGKTYAQTAATCWKYESVLDSCPFIWKDFSEKGYITAYGEDEPEIGSFNFLKKGFAQTPTDYYLRPFMLAAINSLKTKKTQDGLTLCTGPNYSVDFILDYAVDLVKVFHNALYFAFFWMNSFSHEDVNRPAHFDDRILEFLKDLEKSGTLNSTLVVLFSDHGMRFGEIRETFVGWLEERLPFIYFWVPNSFKTTYPDKYQNLIANRNRLTSPFDLHLTLKEILGGYSEGAEGCNSCSSLMKEVKWSRTCEEAGIGRHWCTCSEYKNLSPQGANVDKMANSVVDFVNSVVVNAKDKFKDSTECAALSLSRVHSFRSRVLPKSTGQKQVVILLETKPGGALFEATLAPDQTPLIVNTVSRINSYAKHAYCVDNAYLKKYCYCKTTDRRNESNLENISYKGANN